MRVSEKETLIQLLRLFDELAKEQMPNGCGGVFSFGLKADHDTINKFISELKMIVSAVSLGHEGSLIVFLGEDDERQYLYRAIGAGQSPRGTRCCAPLPKRLAASLSASSSPLTCCPPT